MTTGVGSSDVIDAAIYTGVDRKGIADSTAGLQKALNDAAAESTPRSVYLRAGLYKVSAPLIMTNGVTLFGPNRAQQGAGSAYANVGAVLVPTANFPGQGTYPISAVVAAFGSSVTGLPAGTPTISTYVRIMNIGVSRLSGHSLVNQVDGIAAYGNASSSLISGCFVFGMQNNFALYTDATDNQTPDGWQLQDLVGANAGAYDFNVNCGDLTAINCHVQEDGGGSGAWLVNQAAGNSRLIGCRGDSSGGPGFTLVGPSGSGGGGANSGSSDTMVLIGCGSQGNAKQGVLILDSYTGVSTPAPSNVTFIGCSFDQDGQAGGSGTNYAGIEVNGLAVVNINGTNINVDTGQNGSSPQYAIATSASANGGRVPIVIRVDDSLLCSSVATYSDAAPAAHWSIGGGVQTYIGSHTNHIAAANVGTFAERGWSDTELGWVAQAFDMATASPNINTRLITGATLNLIGVMVRHPVTVSTVDLQLLANGGTLTTNECFVGLYNSAGTLLGLSGDQSTAWGSGAPKTVSATLTAEATGSLSLQPGMYWIAILGNGTTMPSFQSGANELVVNANGRLTASTARYATNGSTLAALPTSITPSSNSLTNTTWWAGLF